MQLLHCIPVPTAEFAALSLLVKNDQQGSDVFVASPYATIPLSTASSCIQELEHFVQSVQKVLKSSSADEMTVEDQLLMDESRILETDAINIFYPSQGHGVALHYTLLQEKSVVQKCACLILGDGKNSSASKSVESVVGIILCVGVSGLPYAHSSSFLVNTMTRLMLDFKSALDGIDSYSDVVECQTCIKSMLSTFLLFEEEEQKTNAMVDTEAVTLDLGGEGPSSMEKLKSPMGAVRKTVVMKRSHGKRAALKGDSIISTSDMKLEVVSAISSGDMARITAEKVAILSVAEKESQLRKYEASGFERRSSMAVALIGKTRIRRRKAKNEADLDGFDCPSSKQQQQQKSSPLMPAPLQPPGLDTASQRMNPTSPRIPKKPAAALPTLLAPRNDVANRRSSGPQSSRRWSMGTTPRGGAAVAPSDSTTTGQAAFNAFATESTVNDSFVNGTFPHQQFAGVHGGASPKVGGAKKNESANNGTSHHHATSPPAIDGRDPWGMIPTSATTEFINMAPSILTAQEERSAPRFELGSPSDERESPAVLSPLSSQQGGFRTARDEAVDSLQRMLLAADRAEMNGLRDDDDTSRGSRGSRSVVSFQNGEWLQGMDEELRSAHSELDELVAKVTPAENGDGDGLQPPRLMINVALNEDLTCSYRQSKMSSCSIEGVVQVQVTCDTRDGVPFHLLVRDPSRHIRIVQENKRFSDASIVNPDDVGIDHKYTVSVPSADDYFPVLRYKCSSELRPVPIRVQTRVRVNEGASCRVALQISSNPANEDDLTDLTIVMGVPLEVKGETLVTTPAGGVWNAAKRSVIWCVAELGDGEKFQLQAEFAMDPAAAPLPPGTKPKFPVLVRCQCMYAQLSDVELEVSDITDVFPADVTMKMARRFRLSHRERS